MSMFDAIASHYVDGVVGGGYAAEVLADSPLAYWRLSESSGAFVDSSGNSKTLTGVGSPNQGAAGPFGSELAASLNGTSQRLASDQGINHNDYSIEFWYRGTDAAGTFASARAAGASLTVVLGPAPVTGSPNGSVAVGVDAGNVWRGKYTSAVTVHDGSWHHIVCTWDGTATTLVEASQMAIYIDGVQAATSDSIYNTTNAPINSGGTGYSFGAEPSGAGWVAGDFSNIALYPVALSGARVAAHYAAA